MIPKMLFFIYDEK